MAQYDTHLIQLDASGNFALPSTLNGATNANGVVGFNGSGTFAAFLQATVGEAQAGSLTTNKIYTPSLITSAIRAQSISSLAAAGASVSLGNFTITNLADPVNPTDGANKRYVDTNIQGLSQKPSAMVATTAALSNSPTYSNGTAGVGATLTAASVGVLTIDGYAVALNDLVLVKNQASAFQNGLYTLTTLGTGGVAYILTRHVDMDSTTEFQGAFIPVESFGTANANTLWLANTGSGAVTVGTTSIPFTQLNGATALSYTAPISISGNTISLNYNARLVNNGGNLDLASGVATPGTYNSVTVDTYGHVTAGSEIVGTSGIVVRTAANTYTARTITGTTNRLSVTNGDGVSGAPTLDISSSYVGQTSITTLGTVTTGVWNGTVISPTYGGTGQTSLAAVPLSSFGAFAGSTSGTTALIATAIAGTTTLTLPAATDTLVGRATTDTLTNKSIDAGQLTGTLAAARFPAFTGDVTTSAGAVATTIAAGAVTFAKMANLAANSVIGNATGSSATPSALTLASAPTASSVVYRDTNANTRFNNIAFNVTTTATAAGTTTLTAASTFIQQFTGSTTQTVVLPDATTLAAGQGFLITNRSTGVVTVNANGGGLIQTMAANSQLVVTAITIGTSAGTWDSAYSLASAGTGSVTSFVFTNSTGITGTVTTASTTPTLSLSLARAGISGLTTADTPGFAGIAFNGSTSGTTTVNATAVAGTTTLTLPAATDTLVGKATTDTFTNKTFNTAGTGNVFQISGTTLTAVTGTGSVVLATSPTIAAPTIGQGANAGTVLFSSRFTDSSPTGNFERYTNAANNADLWVVDITGALVTGIVSASLLTTGSLPDARLSANIPKYVSAPATSTSTGTTGSQAYDTNYVYVCTATNVWRRSPLETW